MLVSDLMTTKIFALRETDTVHDAKKLMAERRIRHVPVVDDDGRFKGLVTQRDILSAGVSRLVDLDDQTAQELDLGLNLGGIMNTKVLVISPQASVREAAGLLMGNKIGCLPVLEGDKLAGILTESDYMKLVVELLDALEKGH